MLSGVISAPARRADYQWYYLTQDRRLKVSLIIKSPAFEPDFF